MSCILQRDAFEPIVELELQHASIIDFCCVELSSLNDRLLEIRDQHIDLATMASSSISTTSSSSTSHKSATPSLDNGKDKGVDARSEIDSVAMKEYYCAYGPRTLQIFDKRSAKYQYNQDSSQPAILSCLYLPALRLWVGAYMDMKFRLLDRHLKPLSTANIQHDEKAVTQLCIIPPNVAILSKLIPPDVAICDTFVLAGSNGLSVWRVYKQYDMKDHNSIKKFEYTFDKLFKFPGFSGWIPSISVDFNRPELVIYAFVDRHVHIFSLRERSLMTSLIHSHVSGVSQVLWYGRSQFYVTACKQGILKAWPWRTEDNEKHLHDSMLSKSPSYIVRAHTKAVIGLALHPTPGLLVSAGNDGYICLINLETGQNLGKFTAGASISHFKFISGGLKSPSSISFITELGYLCIWKIVGITRFYDVAVSDISKVECCLLKVGDDENKREPTRFITHLNNPDTSVDNSSSSRAIKNNIVSEEVFISSAIVLVGDGTLAVRTLEHTFSQQIVKTFQIDLGTESTYNRSRVGSAISDREFGASEVGRSRVNTDIDLVNGDGSIEVKAKSSTNAIELKPPEEQPVKIAPPAVLPPGIHVEANHIIDGTSDYIVSIRSQRLFVLPKGGISVSVFSLTDAAFNYWNREENKSLGVVGNVDEERKGGDATFALTDVDPLLMSSEEPIKVTRKFVPGVADFHIALPFTTSSNHSKSNSGSSIATCLCLIPEMYDVHVSDATNKTSGTTAATTIPAPIPPSSSTPSRSVPIRKSFTSGTAASRGRQTTFQTPAANRNPQINTPKAPLSDCILIGTANGRVMRLNIGREDAINKKDMLYLSPILVFPNEAVREIHFRNNKDLERVNLIVITKHAQDSSDSVKTDGFITNIYMYSYPSLIKSISLLELPLVSVIQFSMPLSFASLGMICIGQNDGDTRLFKVSVGGVVAQQSSELPVLQSYCVIKEMEFIVPIRGPGPGSSSHREDSATPCISSVCFNERENMLMTANLLGCVYLYNLNPFTLLKTIVLAQPIESINLIEFVSHIDYTEERNSDFLYKSSSVGNFWGKFKHGDLLVSQKRYALCIPGSVLIDKSYIEARDLCIYKSEQMLKAGFSNNSYHEILVATGGDDESTSQKHLPSSSKRENDVTDVVSYDVDILDDELPPPLPSTDNSFSFSFVSSKIPTSPIVKKRVAHKKETRNLPFDTTKPQLNVYRCKTDREFSSEYMGPAVPVPLLQLFSRKNIQSLEDKFIGDDSLEESIQNSTSNIFANEPHLSALILPNAAVTTATAATTTTTPAGKPNFEPYDVSFRNGMNKTGRSTTPVETFTVVPISTEKNMLASRPSSSEVKVGRITPPAPQTSKLLPISEPRRVDRNMKKGEHKSIKMAQTYSNSAHGHLDAMSDELTANELERFIESSILSLDETYATMGKKKGGGKIAPYRQHPFAQIQPRAPAAEISSSMSIIGGIITSPRARNALFGNDESKKGREIKNKVNKGAAETLLKSIAHEIKNK